MSKIIKSWDEVPLIMDLAFASVLLGQAPGTLKLQAERGTFPAFKQGNQWRVEKDDLRAHIEKRKNAPQSGT